MSSSHLKSRCRLTTRRVPKARFLKLESEERSWPEVDYLLSSVSKLSLPTRSPRYYIRFLPEIMFLMLTRLMRPGIAQIRPFIRTSKASALIATDSGHREHLSAVAELCPELPLLIVAHGSLRTDLLRQVGALPRLNDGCFLVWGQADIESYRRVFGESMNIRAVGSLRNSFYWRNFRSGKPTPIKKYPISLVSQFADYKEEAKDRPDRTRVLRALKSHLATFCRQENLPIRVLLRPGLSGEMARGAREREILHYQNYFSDVDISFSDPNRPYETYSESDQTEVTVGVPAGAIIESFARGNKVLMFAQNTESGDYFGSPVSGKFLVNEPNYRVFHARLQYLLSLGQSDFEDSFKVEREFVVANACSDIGISLVEEELRRLLPR